VISTAVVLPQRRQESRSGCDEIIEIMGERMQAEMPPYGQLNLR